MFFQLLQWGSFILSLLIIPQAYAVPPNDNFANSAVISGSSGQVGVDMAGATVEPEEPNAGNNPSRCCSAWLTWTAPTTGTVTIMTTQRYVSSPGFHNWPDIGFRVYTGTSLTSLQSVGIHDDSAAWASFNAMAGVQYRIQLLLYFPLPSGSTNVSMNWTMVQATNDSFAGATVISGSSGQIVGDNYNATSEAGEPNNNLDSAGKSVWYKWTAPASGRMEFDISSGDIFNSPSGPTFFSIGIYQGTAVNALSSIRQTHYPAYGVGFNVMAGQTYMILIDSWSAITGYATGQTGTFTLHWGPGPANDDFVNRAPIAGTTGSLTIRNVGATTEAGESTLSEARTVWYEWTPNASLRDVKVSLAQGNANYCVSIYNQNRSTQYAAFCGVNSDVTIPTDQGVYTIMITGSGSVFSDSGYASNSAGRLTWTDLGPASDVDIPTLPQWGFIVLGVILVAGMVYRARREV